MLADSAASNGEFARGDSIKNSERRMHSVKIIKTNVVEFSNSIIGYNILIFMIRYESGKSL